MTKNVSSKLPLLNSTFPKSRHIPCGASTREMARKYKSALHYHWWAYLRIHEDRIFGPTPLVDAEGSTTVTPTHSLLLQQDQLTFSSPLLALHRSSAASAAYWRSTPC